MTQADAVLRDLIARILEGHGFGRSGGTFVRRLEEVVQSVELQKSQWGRQYYLNIGFWILALGPIARVRDRDMQIRLRFDLVLPAEERARIASLLDLDSLLEQHERLSELESLLHRALVPFLEAERSVSALRRGVEEGPLKSGFIKANAKEFLTRPQ